MTKEELCALFDKDTIVDLERHKMPFDLSAFILLNNLCPGDNNLIAAAEHDQIWLRPSLEALIQAGITEGMIQTLVQCGVFVDYENGALSMFV